VRHGCRRLENDVVFGSRAACLTPDPDLAPPWPAAASRRTHVMNAPAPKISFVSLGCPKALVDSERIITQLRAEGYELTKKHAGADLVVVNTCGFLDSAKAESLGAIGEALNENGRVIVTGCMGAEPGEIRDRFPNVLAITGPQQYESVVAAVHEAAPPAHDPFFDLVPPQGVKLTPRHYAYLKISEGCNNRCSFCIIPKLRGDLVSRPAGDVLREAERLVKAGVKEILVISQDTSAYGVDLKYAASPWREREVRARFFDLSQALGELGAWIRLHYVYPYPHVDEAIALMADGKILPYLDIPFQHASPAVLKAMRRPAHQEKTLDRIRRWREICPDLALRSTFIVGFPGETNEDFELLLSWLKEARLERVGCFRYEPVKGAPANDVAAPVPDEVKEERWHRFMRTQQEISAKLLKAKVGRRIPVIIDEPGATVAKGRSKWDAPEIDGNVHVASRRPLRAGDIVTVKIESADAYDLHGVAV
jgi:ribosomal protein S12 methylthiotransferase